MRCHVAPHTGSPSRSAQASGIGPRWRGSRAGCRLAEPSRGTSSAAWGIFHGNPQQSIRSGLVRAEERLDRVLVAREEQVEPGRRGGVRQQQVRRQLPAVVAARREQRDRLVAELAERADERVRERLDRADRDDTQALGHRDSGS